MLKTNIFLQYLIYCLCGTRC